MTKTKTAGGMSDLARLTTFATPKAPRYFVRSVGSSDVSTIHNTWISIESAERFAVEMEDLNPGVEFEIVDLQTGDVL